MSSWLLMIFSACSASGLPTCIEKVHDFWCATEGCTASMSFERIDLCANEFKIQVGGTTATFYDKGIERYSWTNAGGSPWMLSVTHHISNLSMPYRHNSSIKSAEGANSLLEYKGVRYLVYGRITYSTWLTEAPTKVPTEIPTVLPTTTPTQNPTVTPTIAPTQTPTQPPTQTPTQAPTQIPTTYPTGAPTQTPTNSPTTVPTAIPTQDPTPQPTAVPTANPTAFPSENPTEAPSPSPTNNPTPAGVGGENDRTYCSSISKCSLGQGHCDSDNECASGLTCGSNNCRLLHPTALPTSNCCYDKPGIGASDDESYCSVYRKCTEGQGDCDKDDDCVAGLTCGSNNCRSFNPTASPTMDCCYDKPGIGASDDGSFCSPSKKCSVGQGDCDKDDDCAAGLTCGSNNCRSFNPTAAPTMDCCYDKPGIGASDDHSYCSPSRKCSEGQGDCDKNEDCAAGLTCGWRNCQQFNGNAHSNYDCCYKKPGIGASDDWSHCTSSSKCWKGQGDCDNDGDCHSGLICGVDNCIKFHPNALTTTDCCMVKLTLKTSSGHTGWMNGWDGELNWGIGKTQMIHGFFSRHDNHREDRLWAMYTAWADGVTCTPQGVTGYVNGWDQEFTFQCQANQALNGVISVHDNHKEDRRWRFQCCALSSNAYLKFGGWSGWRNDWDQELNFRCKNTEVVVGVHSYHDNGREDRRWEYRCGELMTKRD